MAFKLRKDLLARVRAEQDRLLEVATEADVTAEMLRSVKDELQADFDGKSERWQEGERGEATSTWLDELEELIGEVEELVTAMREQADALGDMREEPEY